MDRAIGNWKPFHLERDDQNAPAGRVNYDKCHSEALQMFDWIDCCYMDLYSSKGQRMATVAAVDKPTIPEHAPGSCTPTTGCSGWASVTFRAYFAGVASPVPCGPHVAQVSDG